ncbi:MAG: DUF4296 domain-containing protein [Muribaculaceae bacterium]|nr:DUF4296 domain-containing protein [Muribaculaceae bacterium]
MKGHGSLYLLPALVAAAITTVSCSKTPGGVLEPEEMASLLADVYRGEAVIEFNHANYSNDSLKKVVKQSVLHSHGVGQEEFDSSLSWYGRHIGDYIKVCDRAVEILEAEAKAIPDDPAGFNQMMVAGDSAQVWPLSRYYHITSLTPGRYLTFSLTPDETWEQGDEYQLAFKIINSRTPVKSLLATSYDDGRAEYANHEQNEDGWSRTTLRLDSTRTSKAIYGFIEFNPSEGENIYVDSVSLIRTRLNPVTYRNRFRQKTFDYGKKNDYDK